MFSLLKQTAIRGRAEVPVTFLRIRQRRNCANFCFFSVFISWCHGFGRGVKLIIIEPSCLPCAGHVRQHSERPCPCKAPADRTRGFPRRPGRRLSCRGPQSLIWCFPQPSL